MLFLGVFGFLLQSSLLVVLLVRLVVLVGLDQVDQLLEVLGHDSAFLASPFDFVNVRLVNVFASSDRGEIFSWQPQWLHV